MRNYPVLKNEHGAETPINWQKTYVNSLVMHTKSLVDYSNYFLADYRRGSDFLYLGVYKKWECKISSEDNPGYITLYINNVAQYNKIAELQNFTFEHNHHYAVVVNQTQYKFLNMYLNERAFTPEGEPSKVIYDEGYGSGYFTTIDNNYRRVVSFIVLDQDIVFDETATVFIKSAASGTNNFPISSIEIWEIPADGINCYSVENLKYHQYRDTVEEAYYFLNQRDWQDRGINPSDPKEQGAQLIRAGRHIINNNQKESNLDTYKDWDNMVIQPIGYTAFYIMTFSNQGSSGRFYFTYTENAQLYYGLDQPITPMAFYTRFFYRDGYVTPETLDGRIFKVPAQPYRNEDYNEDGTPNLNAKWGIQDLQGFYWTDTGDNPVMGFLFKKATLADHSIDPNDNTIGEEIIIDAEIKHSVEVVKNNSAVYTITALGEIASGQTFYPDGSVLYFL